MGLRSGVEDGWRRLEVEEWESDHNTSKLGKVLLYQLYFSDGTVALFHNAVGSLFVHY